MQYEAASSSRSWGLGGERQVALASMLPAAGVPGWQGCWLAVQWIRDSGFSMGKGRRGDLLHLDTNQRIGCACRPAADPPQAALLPQHCASPPAAVG